MRRHIVRPWCSALRHFRCSCKQARELTFMLCCALETCGTCLSAESPGTCVVQNVDRRFIHAAAAILLVALILMRLYDFVFRLIFRHSSRHGGSARGGLIKLTILINAMFLVLSFNYEKRHQILFSFLAFGVQTISHSMYDIYNNKEEIFESDATIDSNTPLFLMFSIMSLYFVNIFLFITFDQYYTDANQINFTIIVSLKLILLTFLTTGFEYLMKTNTSSKFSFYSRLFVPQILEIFSTGPKILISLYLISISSELKKFQKYVQISFFLIRLIASTVMLIYKLYTLARSVYDIILAEKKFKWATEKQLAEYNRLCTICWEPLQQGRILYCNHIFHDGCIKQWLFIDKTCPVCRRNCFRSPSNNQNTQNQNAYVFQINLTNWISFLPVIEIYRNANTTIQNQFEDSPNASEMANQVLSMFPGLSYELILQNITQTGSVQTTISAIMENPEPFFAPESNHDEEENDTFMNLTGQQSDVIYLNSEEFKKLLNANPDDYTGAFNPCSKDNSSTMTLEEHADQMKEYSRMQYLLKNVANVRELKGQHTV